MLPTDEGFPSPFHWMTVPFRLVILPAASYWYVRSGFCSGPTEVTAWGPADLQEWDR